MSSPNVTCPKCRKPGLPRGYEVETGVCWFCVFTALSPVGMIEARPG